jgi:hypothetical protein
VISPEWSVLSEASFRRNKWLEIVFESENNREMKLKMWIRWISFVGDVSLEVSVTAGKSQIHQRWKHYLTRNPVEME